MLIDFVEGCFEMILTKFFELAATSQVVTPNTDAFTCQLTK